jgi:hypothetical protein
VGFRFQRHVSTGLGRTNISKSGVSLSEGFRGAHITFGKTPRLTLGIPGSGLSWTQTMPHGRSRGGGQTSFIVQMLGFLIGGAIGLGILMQRPLLTTPSVAKDAPHGRMAKKSSRLARNVSPGPGGVTTFRSKEK